MDLDSSRLLPVLSGVLGVERCQASELGTQGTWSGGVHALFKDKTSDYTQ